MIQTDIVARNTRYLEMIDHPDYLMKLLPFWLVMMFSCQDAGVEEDQGDDQPEHELGLADVADSAPVLPVPSANSLLPPRHVFQLQLLLFKLLHLFLHECLRSTRKIVIWGNLFRVLTRNFGWNKQRSELYLPSWQKKTSECLD